VVANLCTVGKTVLLTTHDMEEARYLADRVGVIAAGRLVALGTPSELVGNSLQERGTIRSRLPASIGMDLFPDVGAALTLEIDRVVELRSSSPTRDLRTLTTWALDLDSELEELTLAPPSFEDTYLALIAEAGAAEVEGADRA
jgi:ABC-2 type transport system ATP-binding protein